MSESSTFSDPCVSKHFVIFLERVSRHTWTLLCTTMGDAVGWYVVRALRASTQDVKKWIINNRLSYLCPERRANAWAGYKGHTPESGSLGFLKEHDPEAHAVVLAARHAVQAEIYPNVRNDGTGGVCFTEDAAVVRAMRVDKPKGVRALAKRLRRFGYGLLATRLEESIGTAALWPFPWSDDLQLLREFVASEVEACGPMPRLNLRVEEVPIAAGAANAFVRLCRSPKTAARAMAAHWRTVWGLMPSLQECMATVGFALDAPDASNDADDIVFSKLITLSMAFAQSAQGSPAASLVRVSSMGYDGNPLCNTAERAKAARALQPPLRWDHGMATPVSLLAVHALRHCDRKDPNRRIVARVMGDFVSLVERAMDKPVALFPCASIADEEATRDAIEGLDHELLAGTLDKLCTHGDDDDSFCHLPHLAMMWWYTFRRYDVFALSSPPVLLNGSAHTVGERRKYMLRLKNAAGFASEEWERDQFFPTKLTTDEDRITGKKRMRQQHAEHKNTATQVSERSYII